MRALGWFWAVVILLAVAGAGFLQWHGPPAHGVPSQAANTVEPVATSAPTLLAVGGPIVPPDPALLEPSKDYAGGFLPRIGVDHRTPAQAYAATAAPAEARPMVAILLAGIGMSATDSEQAIVAAPAAVSLAISPYTVQPEALLAETRLHGHEYFVSIPMEPRGYPLDNPGNRALLTGNSPAMNDQILGWALTRFGGYVGATGALGALHGERFADSPTQLGPILDELARRGLLYVDPRSGPGSGAALPPSLTGPPVTGRGVDVPVDPTPGAAEIDASLASLEQVARTRGSALGLVSTPRPVAIARLVAWAAGLKERGLALVPVSLVVRTPPRAQQARQ